MAQTRTVTCCFCGKSSPISSASFKKGIAEDLGALNIHECRGRKGFPLVSQTPLIQHIDDPQVQSLLEQMGDMASGVLMVIMEHELPIYKPGLLRLYESLKRRVGEERKERDNVEDALRSDLDEANNKVLDLQTEVQKAYDELDRRRSDADELSETKRKLIEEIKIVKKKLQEYTGWEREKNRLNYIITDQQRRIQQLEQDIKMYEEASYR